MRAWLVALLLAAVALSGCFEDEPKEPSEFRNEDDDADPFNDGGTTLRDQPDGPDAEGGHGHPGPPVNVAPTFTFTADVGSGPAPLNVTFFVNASDANGDPLRWFLDVDGDGAFEVNRTDLPANHTHNFTEVGVYTANLTITDGENVVWATLPINATGATGPTVNGPAPVVLGGAALIINPLSADFACIGLGIDGDLHSFAPAEAGWAYALEPAAAYSAYWWSGGAYVGVADDAGTVPEGADQIEVCSDSALLGQVAGSALDGIYTVTFTHPDYDPNLAVAVETGEASIEDLCPTDELAVGDAAVGYYITPADTASSPGAIWIYEESNGIDGLQRNDDTVPTDCPTPDTIIF